MALASQQARSPVNVRIQSSTPTPSPRPRKGSGGTMYVALFLFLLIGGGIVYFVFFASENKAGAPAKTDDAQLASLEKFIGPSATPAGAVRQLRDATPAPTVISMVPLVPMIISPNSVRWPWNMLRCLFVLM